MKIRATLAALVLALLAPAAALAGKSPTQLLADSVAAAKSASSVHLVAVGIPDGKESISLDLRLTAGKGGGGRMTIGKQVVDIIVLGKFVYFKAGPSFWRAFGGSSDKAVIQLLANRWVKVSASNKDFTALIDLTDLNAFINGVSSSHGKLADGGTKTINGHRAIGIKDTAKSGGTLWVSATGAPYPLELAPSSGPGKVDFEDWNASVHIKAPANAVDFSHVKG